MNTKKLLTIGLGLVAVAAILPAAAQAGSTQALPWEVPLQRIEQSLTGPVAYSLGAIGIFAGGIQVAYGGEMNELSRRICTVVMAVGIAVAAAKFLSSLYGGSAATIF